MNKLTVIKYQHEVHYVGAEESQNYVHQKTKIRRFLRDPDGNIWNDSLLLRLYNDVQKDLQNKTGFLQNVQAVRVPPVYDMSYLHDWEFAYLPTSGGSYYQALSYYQAGDNALCFRWEAQAVADIDESATHSGSICTHPFEHFIDLDPGELVKLRLPYGFSKSRAVFWDKEPIDFIDEKELSSEDSTWMTRMGEPQRYWRPDTFDNHFCLYPQPSSVTWDDTQTSVAEPDYNYTYEWESDDGYVSGTTYIFTKNYDDAYDYVWDWEGEHLEFGSAPGDDEYTMRCMRLWEVQDCPADYKTGMVIYTSGDEINNESGTIIDSSEYLFNQANGITTDTVDADDAPLFVFDAVPTDIQDAADESDFPSYLRKYIEYGVLERAYAANTDGQILSLRDYWATRKTIGLAAIKKFMSKRTEDRNYRLTTKGVPGQRTRRDPRLPDGYPAIIR